MHSAIVFIADGTEEMEFTITYDTLVRAGVKVTSVFVPAPREGEATTKPPATAIATCSRGVKIVADTTLDQLIQTSTGEGTNADAGAGAGADLLVVPGGAKGAETISRNGFVQRLLLRQYEGRKLVGMICAGSLAAKTSGLPRQAITSHPGVKSELDKDYDYREDPVVVSGNLITSRGPGTAFPFALKLVEILVGPEKRAEVQGPMIFPPGAI